MTADGSAPGAPHFDIAFRGYDRRQVDEHVTRLQRVLGRLRADLDAARQQSEAGPPSPAPYGGRPRPARRARPGAPPPVPSPDAIGSFTDRMQRILQAAEDEAAEIRRQAHKAARAEQENTRAQLAHMMRQRDAVQAEVARLRDQMEGLLRRPPGWIPGVTPPREDRARGPLPESARPGAPRSTSSPSDAAPSGAGSAPAASGEVIPHRERTGAPETGSWTPPSPAASAGTPPSSSPPPARTAESRASSAPANGRASSPSTSSLGASSPQPASSQPAASTREAAPGTGPTVEGAAAPSPGSADAGPDARAQAADQPASNPAPDRRAAHRLPSGAYPMVGEPGSFRPRSDAEPEPGDLFRPASVVVSRAEPAAGAEAEPEPAGGAGDRSGPVAAPGSTAENGRTAYGDTTTVVGAVRRSDAGDAQAGNEQQREEEEEEPASDSEDGPAASASRSG